MASNKLTLIFAALSIAALLVGCSGDDDSSSNPVAPVDTAPPALPGNLAVDYAAEQHTATITWDQNVTDADFAGFLVSRGSYDGSPVELVDTPQTANSFQDDVDGCGRLVTYYIYSVDTSGNVSAAATVSLTIPVPDEDEDRDERCQF